MREAVFLLCFLDPLGVNIIVYRLRYLALLGDRRRQKWGMVRHSLPCHNIQIPTFVDYLQCSTHRSWALSMLQQPPEITPPCFLWVRTQRLGPEVA